MMMVMSPVVITADYCRCEVVVSSFRMLLRLRLLLLTATVVGRRSYCHQWAEGLKEMIITAPALMLLSCCNASLSAATNSAPVAAL